MEILYSGSLTSLWDCTPFDSLFQMLISFARVHTQTQISVLEGKRLIYLIFPSEEDNPVFGGGGRIFMAFIYELMALMHNWVDE